MMSQRKLKKLIKKIINASIGYSWAGNHSIDDIEEIEDDAIADLQEAAQALGLKLTFKAARKMLEEEK